MSKNTDKTNDGVEPSVEKKEFKGYTMEELRYQKALVALRKEFVKSNMAHSIEGLKHPMRNSRVSKSIPLLSSAAEKYPSLRLAGSATRILTSTLLRNLKPWDYVMLGISAIGPIRKAIGMFRKKK